MKKDNQYFEASVYNYKRRKEKPKAPYKIFTLYWWNPLAYVAILFSLPYWVIRSMFKAFWEWCADTWELITKGNWN